MGTTQVELLKALAKEIRDEHSVGANTATRVGTLLYALAERSYSLDDVANEYLNKIEPDTANELITFLKGVAFGTTYGITEEGAATLSKLGIGNSVLSFVDGKSKLVVDEIEVLVKAIFEELQIERTTYVGGSFMASHAGIICTGVEDISSNSTVTAYKCSFKSSEDNVTIESGFSEGSLAYCKEFGTSPTQYYWRKVIEVGADYITLSNISGEYDSSSTAPLAGDDIVARGHATDAELQNVIEIASVGTGSPSIVLYQGVDDFTTIDKDVLSFSFVDGELKFASYGDAHIGARDSSTGLFFDSVTKEMDIKANKISFTSTTTGEDVLVEDALSDVQESVDKKTFSSVNLLDDSSGEFTKTNGHSVLLKTNAYFTKGETYTFAFDFVSTTAESYPLAYLKFFLYGVDEGSGESESKYNEFSIEVESLTNEGKRYTGSFTSAYNQDCPTLCTNYNSSLGGADTITINDPMLVVGNSIDSSWSASNNDSKDDIQTAIGDIQIGGANLYSTQQSIQIIGTGSITARTSSGFTLTSSTNPCTFRVKNLIDKTGYYTVSFYASSSTVSQIAVDICDEEQKTYTISSAPIKIEHTVNVTQYTSSSYHFCDIRLDGVGDVVVSDFMFENGTKASSFRLNETDQENSVIRTFFGGDITDDYINDLKDNSAIAPFVFDTTSGMAYLANAIVSKLAVDSALVDLVVVKILKAINSSGTTLTTINADDDGKMILYNSSGTKRLELYPSDSADEAGIKIYTSTGDLNAVISTSGINIPEYNSWTANNLIYITDLYGGSGSSELGVGDMRWSYLPEEWQDSEYAGSGFTFTHELISYEYSTINADYLSYNGVCVRKNGDAPSNEVIIDEYLDSLSIDDGTSSSITQALTYKAHGFYIKGIAAQYAGTLAGTPYYKRTFYKYINGELTEETEINSLLQ